MRELRFWDTFNRIMTYSSGFKNMVLYFISRQMAIDGDNGIEDMYSTGLKDKNEKRIFERDILLCPKVNDRPDLYFEVYWNKESAEFNLQREGNTSTGYSLWNYFYLVAGNRFENPELLHKGEKEK